ncbi:unnamed protein product [Prorocentrum cordatum]|uniref:Uncharacterized protein n=1 Tax=Prorocentrum cordatum TaxID=2364126 RepID=A0ABN9UDA7_9DINO|nr:unnamed protein product [Polarella glacialis]
MPGSTKAARAAAPLEASRGALMAVHAAAGLAAAGGMRDSARLLRAAEGLVRTAVAELVGQPTPPAEVGAGPQAVPPRRRRPRGRGGRMEVDSRFQLQDVVEEKPPGGGAAATAAVGVGAPADGGVVGAAAAAAEAMVQEDMKLPSDVDDDEWADEVPPRRTPHILREGDRVRLRDGRQGSVYGDPNDGVDPHGVVCVLVESGRRATVCEVAFEDAQPFVDGAAAGAAAEGCKKGKGKKKR